MTVISSSNVKPLDWPLGLFIDLNDQWHLWRHYYRSRTNNIEIGCGAV